MEIANKEVQKNGMIKLTFFLKNEKDKIINVLFVENLNLIN